MSRSRPAVALLSSGFVLLCLFPLQLLAHVRWFVGPDYAGTAVAPFTLGDPAVVFWGVLALVLVGCSVWLDRRILSPPQPLEPWRTLFARSLPVLTGLSLLLSSEAGSLIAPHFLWDDTYARSLLVLQSLTGLLLLFPPTAYSGALTLLALYAGLVVKTGPLAALEYFNVVGTAAFLLCMFHPLPHVRARLEPFALPLLRIATGIALVVLGFEEKLLNPHYAQQFLDTYMWNFMRNLGVENYSDRLFILSAGTMEVVFGVILILGTTTRLNIIAISGFMLTSNLTFLAEGHMREALTEIIGHLPIMATAIVCVAFGGGRLRPVTLLRRRAPAYGGT